jgi:hypothetical protein
MQGPFGNIFTLTLGEVYKNDILGWRHLQFSSQQDHLKVVMEEVKR